jgi:hypothetical protein
MFALLCFLLQLPFSKLLLRLMKEIRESLGLFICFEVEQGPAH